MSQIGVSGIGGYRLNRIYLAFYAFLSGFVFFEPSPAEIWAVLLIPLVMHFIVARKSSLSILFIFYVPLVLSVANGYLKFGTLNTRFLIIDVYLSVVFFLFINVLAAQQDDDELLLRLMMISWTIAGLVNVFAGLAGYVLHRFIIGPVTLIGFGIRLIGFFKDPNVLGPFLVPPAFYWMQRLFTGRKKLVPIILMVLLTMGIVLSFSRAGWLNYACGIAIGAIHYLFKGSLRQKFAVAAVAVLGLVALSQLFSFDLQIGSLSFQSFLQGRIGIQTYDQNRFRAWLEIRDLLPLAPVFGVGPGNYEAYAGMSTHSTFIRYLGERGIVGLFTMLIALGIVLWHLARRPVDIFIKASIVGVLANSVFVDTLHWRHLWILLALLLSRRGPQTQERSDLAIALPGRTS